ncbi:ABC transporter permease [Actinoplanes oblitus]|uniref:ABC transporter permease n=1 Tax=Actinoplanes oblitus TaxID=3040509 RepID=A0ABY8WD45_9ACTN|nr:FtsX-like permease family protein [Actinoplanes oblitus]WIM94968.1 ABC transporter permease [Actinoplanes oblitus]
MFALVLGAVRTRTAQVLTILVLATVAAAVAVAGPWFAYASADRSATADLAAAGAAERVLTAQRGVNTAGDPAGALTAFAGRVRDRLRLPIGEPVTGLFASLTLVRGASGVPVRVAFRDGFCEHARLDGRCPSAPGEAAISEESARRLGVGRGGTLETQTSMVSGTVTVRVVALYTRQDPDGPYWASDPFRGSGGLDPVFVPVATFRDKTLWTATSVYDVVLPDAMIRGDRALAAELAAADGRLGVDEVQLSTNTRRLLGTIARDRSTVLRGVLTAGVQLVVLTWFAIGLAGRYTSRARRADAALLKLRGVGRSGVLRLVWGQHLVPLTLGVLLGAPIGVLLARVLIGGVPGAGDRSAALTWSAVAAGAVLLGGLAVLALIEAAVLRRPVAALLRPVAPGGNPWWAALADALLLAVAAAALFQARSGSAAVGVDAAAPALVALAVGLLAARLLGRVAARAGRAALRGGRLRLGLSALQLSRSAGAERLFALVVVGVAGFLTAAGGQWAEGAARTERSTADLGAVRVLTVPGTNRTALVEAVRRADPGGRAAMAAVVSQDSEVRVLEVDTTRLAAIAAWRPDYGPVTALPLATAAANQGGLPPITGDRLTLRYRRDGSQPVALSLSLRHEATGAPVTVSFGVLGAGERTVDVPVGGCAEAPGCQIVNWSLTSAPDRTGRTRPPPPGAAVTVRELRQDGAEPVVLDVTTLGDIARWRPGTVGSALDVAATGGALRLIADRNSGGQQHVGAELWAAGTRGPLPVVLAGPTPEAWRYSDALLEAYGEPAPVQVTATVPALPVVGRSGVLVDLDATRRLSGVADPGGEFQVWLAPGAPSGIVDALTAAGLTIGTDTTAGQLAERLRGQGPAAVVRFALLTGTAAMLLAAVTVAVGIAAERRSLADQLTALRRQGLPARVAVGAGYSGPAALIVTGVLTGVLAAILSVAATGTPVPAFTDGWRVLSTPAPLSPGVVTLAALAALILFGLVGWLALRPLIRGLHRC